MDNKVQRIESSGILTKIYLRNSDPFKKQKEANLTDPQFDKKIEDTKELAEELNENFAKKREEVKKGINIIHKNVMRRLKADTEMSKQAKTYYDNVYRAYTYSNANVYIRSVNREKCRENFKKAVQYYLNFVQEIDINNQGKDKAIAKLLANVEDMNPKDIRYLMHKVKMASLANAKDAITIDFKKNPPQKKKVRVGFTGGTIGSVIVEGGKIVQPSVAKEQYGVDAKDIKALLLDKYNEKYENQNMEIAHEEIMETLSENMTIKDWIKLAKELNGILDKIESSSEKCDGIILTHGSDTLGHTANFLALLLADRKLKVPVVLVSSNYALEDPRANGVENFKGALDFLTHVDLPPNVYVAENSHYKDEVEIILASRVTQCQSITDNFRSTSKGKEGEKSMRSLGVIANDKFLVLDKELYQELREENRDDRPTFNLFEGLESLEEPRILHIQPKTGLTYDDYDLDKYDAIFHETYHGGSACTEGDKGNLLKFAAKCHKLGKDLHFGPIYGDADRALYDSTIKIVAKTKNRDVLPLMNLSPEMALMKLQFAYALYPQDEEARNKFLETKINHEYVLPDTILNRDRGYKEDNEEMQDL